jgi:hypothetical protein
MRENFKQYIGKRFIVKGFNEPRELEILEGYYLGNSKQYPAFKCRVITDTKFFKIGDRENFLYKDIIRAGQLVKEIKVLSA